MLDLTRYDLSKLIVWTTQVIIRSLEQNLYVGTSLVDMFCKCGQVNTAKKTFDCLDDKNVKTWTAMLAGMQGCVKEARLVCRDAKIWSATELYYVHICSLLPAATKD